MPLVETVCCSCCRDNPVARVAQEIMDCVNKTLRNKIKSNDVYESEKRSERYWIVKELRELFQQRLQNSSKNEIIIAV
jgi:hypothetical protein